MKVLSRGFSSTLYAFLYGHELVHRIEDADIIVNPTEPIYYGKIIVLTLTTNPELVNQLKEFNKVQEDDMSTASSDNLRRFIPWDTELNRINIEQLRCLEMDGKLFIEVPKQVTSDGSPLLNFLRVFMES